MKKVQLIIAIIYILSMMLSSCENIIDSKQRSRYVCNCEEQAKLQKWVLEGIKPANNMSDEEMEDVIAQLTKEGIRIHCKLKPIWVKTEGEIDWEKQKIDSCEIIMQNYY